MFLKSFPYLRWENEKQIIAKFRTIPNLIYADYFHGGGHSTNE